MTYVGPVFPLLVAFSAAMTTMAPQDYYRFERVLAANYSGSLLTQYRISEAHQRKGRNDTNVMEVYETMYEILNCDKHMLTCLQRILEVRNMTFQPYYKDVVKSVKCIEEFQERPVLNLLDRFQIINQLAREMNEFRLSLDVNRIFQNHTF